MRDSFALWNWMQPFVLAYRDILLVMDAGCNGSVTQGPAAQERAGRNWASAANNAIARSSI